MKIKNCLNINSNYIWKKIKIFDILGHDFTLEFEGSQKFQSSKGAIASLLIFVFVCSLCYLFGKEIFERKLPTVRFSQEIQNSSEIYLRDFPIMFKIQGMNGLEIIDYC